MSKILVVDNEEVLRALQENEIERVGGNRPIRVDVRLIAATNKNLRDQISKGNFREDLYYRLNVIPINLPPLRERREDIPLLIDHFLKGFSNEYGRPLKVLTSGAVRILEGYRWPGNVRDLRNLIERVIIMVDKDIDR